MVRETGHIVVRKCGRCNDCCSVLFFWGSCHETENNLGPGLHGRADPFASGRCGGCRVHGRTGAPPDPLPEQAQVLQPDPTGARRQRRHIGRRAPHAVPGADGAVRRAGRDGNGRAIHGAGRADGCDVRHADDTDARAERGADAQHRRRNGADGGAGSCPHGGPGPEEPHIVTDLVSRVWRSGELDGDTLRFYAYAAGSGDLSLRVYYKESGSHRKQRHAPSAGGRPGTSPSALP